MNLDWGALKVYQAGRLSVVGFAGHEPPVDVNMLAYETSFRRLIDEYKCRDLAIDLTGVHMLPSRMIGLLVSLTRREDLQIHLYNPSRDCVDSLKVAHVHQLIQIHEVCIDDAEVFAHFQMVYQNDAAIIRLTEQLLFDVHTCYEISDDLIELLDHRNIKHVVINLSAVRAIGSTMLSMLMKINQEVANRQGQLKLCGVGHSIEELLSVTNLLDRFEIYPDEEATAHPQPKNVPE